MSLDGTGAHEFDLVDAKGKSHTYIVTEHPAGEGTEIVFELLGMGAPTALQFLGAALTSDDLLRSFLGLIGGAELHVDDGMKALGAVGDIDWSGMSAELHRALASGKAPAALVRRMLSRTIRDGQRLKEPLVYDGAYQANYWELAQLVRKVIAINGFFPGLPTSAS